MNSVLYSQSTNKQRIVSIAHWLEDCTNLYVKFVRKPSGIEFPVEEMLDIPSIQIDRLNQIIAQYPHDNIWRSWQLFSDEPCKQFVSYVPLLIDIDNEKQDLEGAYSLTRDCLDLIENLNKYNSPESLRVIFSGKKGFHIEARPFKPTDNQLFRNTLLEELEKLGSKNMGCKNCFENGTIDVLHDFVRLTGSINSWREGDNIKMRRVIQFTPDIFRKSQLTDIIAKSERINPGSI